MFQRLPGCPISIYQPGTGTNATEALGKCATGKTGQTSESHKNIVKLNDFIFISNGGISS